MEVREYQAPFRHWTVDWPVEPALIVESARELSRPRDVSWVSYDNDSERKSASRDVAAFGPYTKALFSRLLSGKFTLELQAALGLSIPGLVADDALHGGGVHVLGAGGRLGCHIDYALHPRRDPPMERRLNLVLYLTPGWRGEWGGATELYDDAAEEVAARVPPLLGLALVWEPGDLTYHGTQAVSDDCPLKRVTAAVYYLAPARPTAVRRRALFVPQRGGK